MVKVLACVTAVVKIKLHINNNRVRLVLIYLDCCDAIKKIKRVYKEG